MEALHNLGIDYKILFAQFLNFTIVLFVLTKLLYQPVLKHLEERKKKIADGLAHAEEAQKKVEKADKEYANKIETAKQQSAKLMEEARLSAEKERKSILAEAEKEASQIKSAARSDMENERKKMQQEMQSKVGTLAIAVVEKALRADLGKDFYDKQLERAMKDMSMA